MTARLVDAVTGLRNTRRAIGDGTLAGRHLLATPAYPPPREKAQTATHDDPAVDGIEPGHLHIPSTLDPTAVVEGPADPGGSGELADALHVHAFALSDLTPQPVTDDPGVPGGTGEPADAGHAHHFDPQAAGIPEWDVNATPDTLALRGPAGTVSVAVPTAGAHAIPNSETSVSPVANTIGRRTAAGEMEVAPATAGTHAIAYSQSAVAATADTIGRRTAGGQMEVAPSTAGTHALADSQASQAATADSLARRTSAGRLVAAEGVADSDVATVSQLGSAAPAEHGNEAHNPDFAPASDLTDHEAAEGLGTHGASASATGVGIAGRDINSNIGVGSATHGSHATSRNYADDRYVNMSTGTDPQAMTNRLQVPAGSDAAPGLEVDSGSGFGLYATPASLGITVGSGDTYLFGPLGVFPSAGKHLGSPTSPFRDISSDGVIETSAAPAGGPAINAPNGAIEGADFVTPGSLFADSAAFGMRSAQHVAVTGGTGTGEGIVAGVKTGGNLRVQVEAGLSYRPVAASSFDVNSDARRKVPVEGEERDHLADVLAAPVDRFRRREQIPVRPEGADERMPPTEIREVIGEEQLGWLANNLTPDVAVLMGSDTEGFEVGYAVEQQLAKLWEAFRASHLDHAARLDALESR